MSLFRSFLSRNSLNLSAKCSKFLTGVRTLKTSTCLESGFTLIHSANAKLNKNIVDRYMCLPAPECVCVVEYVWIDGTGSQLRSKARTLGYTPDSHREVPNWGFDPTASAVKIAKDTDVILTPVAMYNDPFRRSTSKLVLCDAYDFGGKPLPTNHRHSCAEALGKVCEHEVMWGIEQQYRLFDVDNRPFGWPVILGQPTHAGGYYCGVGASKVYGREIAESHYKACLYAGVQISSIHADAAPSQWEFQIGVSPGIKGADDLWMGRYILGRIAEEYGVNINYDPKPYECWPGSSCHYNVSTKGSRKDGGLTTLEEFMEKLSKRHEEHLKRYDPCDGCDNKLRLTGKDGSSSAEKFTKGVSDKSLSVRVTKETQTKRKGYLEDRRPAANSDPYAVCDIIVRTCLLDEC